MGDNLHEEINILREWAPLTDLFNKLPIRTSSSIFSQEVKLTCVDVLTEFLALGTNSGIVYWYDRQKNDLQRLRCENPNAMVTSVKIVSTVDYMVACGNCMGNISIFQIPKSHPDSIPDCLKPKKQQVERYTVAGLHKAAVSAIEWSKNGMKLFSGDRKGGVVYTEIDFNMHICKSLEILNEAYEVVQLSYNLQRLLVSTTYRSIICQKQEKWKVCQVGKKDRKSVGTFGGLIHQNGLRTSDTNLYCTRPGLRIWIADIEGNVEKTLLFKDLLNKECPEVPIINPISKSLRYLKPQKEPSFGKLLPFNELLVTFNNDVVYILDPQLMTVLSTISHLRSVLDVSTYKNEIFILEEERSLIRISYRPELAPESDQYASAIGQTFLPISTSIKDLKTKLQASNILPAIPSIVNVHTDETLIMNAEEAKESPIKLKKNFDDIGKREFNETILFKKYNNKKKKSDMGSSMASLSSNSSEEKDLSYARPTLMNLSAVGVLPDLRSPQSINTDIEYKEKILADILSLDKVKIPLEKLELEIEGEVEEATTSQCHNNVSVVMPRVRPAVVRRNETPALKQCPNDWKINNIKLTHRKQSNASESDTSLNDWEII